MWVNISRFSVFKCQSYTTGHLMCNFQKKIKLKKIARWIFKRNCVSNLFASILTLKIKARRAKIPNPWSAYKTVFRSFKKSLCKNFLVIPRKMLGRSVVPWKIKSIISGQHFNLYVTYLRKPCLSCVITMFIRILSQTKLLICNIHTKQ